MLRKPIQYAHDPANGIWLAPVGTVARYVLTTRCGRVPPPGHGSLVRPDEVAGKAFILEAGGKSIRGTVGRSGSCPTFKETKIGEMTLRPGKQNMVLWPATAFKSGALLDLRELRPVPKKESRW